MSVENRNVDQAASLAQEIGETLSSRNGTHGDPIENHDHIARLWSDFLGTGDEDHAVLSEPLSGDMVADMMVLLKLSRKRVGGLDIDHYRDTIGYASIASLYVPPAEEANDPDESGRRQIKTKFVGEPELAEDMDVWHDAEDRYEAEKERRHELFNEIVNDAHTVNGIWGDDLLVDGERIGDLIDERLAAENNGEL